MAGDGERRQYDQAVKREAVRQSTPILVRDGISVERYLTKAPDWCTFGDHARMICTPNAQEGL